MHGQTLHPPRRCMQRNSAAQGLSRCLAGGRFWDDEPRNRDTEEITAKGRSAPEQPRPTSSSIARRPSHSCPELTSPTSNDTAREIRGRSASRTSPRRRRLPFPHAGRSPLTSCGMLEFPLRSHRSVLGARLICRATVLHGRTGKKTQSGFLPCAYLS